MRVIRAKVLGFCMGVRRAVDLACAEAARRDTVYTLGPLIHNPRALEELRSQGVEILDENALPENLDGASVIIRAHGISPCLEARIREKGGLIIDATCPRVKASQLKAKVLAREGYFLFLAGEAEHAEIAGIRGYAESGRSDRSGAACCTVAGAAVRAEEAAAALRDCDPGAKTALIAQTTISAEEYRAIGEAVKKYFPENSKKAAITSKQAKRY